MQVIFETLAIVSTRSTPSNLI